MKYDMHSHWRDSARQPRLFIVDARAALLVTVFLFHPRWWTFILAILFIIILGVLEYLKLPLTVAMRIVLSTIAGKKKIRQVRSSS